jgi:hypothetical protein
VIENRVSRGVFEFHRKKKENWIKFHHEELYNLCCSPNIVRVMK